MAPVLLFAYGSVLHDERLYETSPTAKFRTIAKLPNYKLVFNDVADFESPWHGAMANIAKSDGDVVWGVVYQIDKETIKNIERNMTGCLGIYHMKEVVVYSPDNNALACVCLEMRNALPGASRPSPQYLSIIVAGAAHRGLPEKYIDMLKDVPHNGYQGKLGLSEHMFMNTI
ncbi:gamma-glutamylcyclotransferase-like [Ptychodera flava]|uniref:gamma-glutamylcyclotransferase-like n=1 Tax=Ptychodera flava TaxID=63121 RepID=UPI00396A82F1